MKKLFPATLIAVALVSAPAMAELELGLDAAAEHEIEASHNNLDLTGSLSGLPYDVKVVTNFNFEDQDAGVNFDYTGIDLDVHVPFYEGVSTYIKNDLDADLNHVETTVGVKVKFL